MTTFDGIWSACVTRVWVSSRTSLATLDMCLSLRLIFELSARVPFQLSFDPSKEMETFSDAMVERFEALSPHSLAFFLDYIIEVSEQIGCKSMQLHKVFDQV